MQEQPQPPISCHKLLVSLLQYLTHKQPVSRLCSIIRQHLTVAVTELSSFLPKCVPVCPCSNKICTTTCPSSLTPNMATVSNPANSTCQRKSFLSKSSAPYDDHSRSACGLCSCSILHEKQPPFTQASHSISSLLHIGVANARREYLLDTERMSAELPACTGRALCAKHAFQEPTA